MSTSSMPHFNSKEFAEAYARATAVFAASENIAATPYAAATVEPWLIRGAMGYDYWIVPLSEKPDGLPSNDLLVHEYDMFYVEIDDDEIQEAIYKTFPNATARELERAVDYKPLTNEDINGNFIEAAKMSSFEKLGLDFSKRPFFSPSLSLKTISRHGVRTVFDLSGPRGRNNQLEAVLGVGFDEAGHWEVRLAPWDDKRHSSVSVADRAGLFDEDWSVL